jgi:hypothetical protein
MGKGKREGKGDAVEKGAWSVLAEHGEERSLGDFLMEELYSFVGEGWEQEDDITLLTLQRSTASR